MGAAVPVAEVLLGVEVLRVTESDRESDLPQRSRDVPVYALERASVLQAGKGNLQGGQDFRCQQVEDGASVDQHLGDLEVVDDG